MQLVVHCSRNTPLPGPALNGSLHPGEDVESLDE